MVFETSPRHHHWLLQLGIHIRSSVHWHYELQSASLISDICLERAVRDNPNNDSLRIGSVLNAIFNWRGVVREGLTLQGCDGRLKICCIRSKVSLHVNSVLTRGLALVISPLPFLLMLRLWQLCCEECCYFSTRRLLTIHNKTGDSNARWLLAAVWRQMVRQEIVQLHDYIK